jgi:outer membrane protein assembly factor BamB
MYQGDPTHSADACSSITTSNLAGLRPAWFVSTPGTVTATPSVSGGKVFVGDSTGELYALDQATGAKLWTFDAVAAHDCFVDAPHRHADAHSTGFGEITSSATVASIGGRPTVFVGAGGSLFALDAADGACLWAEDTDPADPTSAIEIESSPVVDTAVAPPEVMVGNDGNSSPGIAVTGLMAFNAATGALLWKYEPERDATLTPGEFGGSSALALSCGDGRPDPYCTPQNVPGIAPNSPSYADGCGDVWSSPALDASYPDPAGYDRFQGSAARAPAGWSPKRITVSGRANSPGASDGLVVFGTGNCSASPDPAAARAHGDYVYNQAVFALDAVTGVRVWDFVEPYNIYDNNPNEPGGGDDDFGSSPVIAELGRSAPPRPGCSATSAGTALVVEGSKSGYAYGLCEATGKALWSTQVSQPGQFEQGLAGSIGGAIGSPALGSAGGRPTVFFTSAIPLPFSNDGLRQPGGGDSNISHCPGAAISDLPLLPACPDESLLANPERAVGLSAVDAATGSIVWYAAAAPTYAATTYTNGVVFDPETLASGVVAYQADDGQPLWTFPLGASPSSGAAIVGDSVFLGAGESEGSAGGEVLPPQANGVWCFSTSAATAIPNFTPPGPPAAPIP